MTNKSYDDSTTAQAVRKLAVDLARDIERRQMNEDFLMELREDTLEVVADTQGQVTLVLGVGGPRTELRLGFGQPMVAVYWGGEEASCPVFLDPSILDDEIGALWHWAMAQSMSNPPYEG